MGELSGSGKAIDESPGVSEASSTLRATLEFLVLLLVGVLCCRTFVAEAYIVPTGSMAPTLLGKHFTEVCPNCEARFVVGADEEGAAATPLCPNCGEDRGMPPGMMSHGDRLLVQKHLFELRPPGRWESIVFENPADSSQAYVKRVVGLPGERVLIQAGDVVIDGQIARKSPEQQRALRILVYDQTNPGRDSSRFPRWSTLRRAGDQVAPSGWNTENRVLRRPADPSSAGSVDWVQYRHWQPDRERYGPVLDFLAYNGRELGGRHVVHDLMIDAKLALGPGVDGLHIRLRYMGERFVVEIPTAGPGKVRVLRNDRPIPIQVASRTPSGWSGARGESRKVHLEASVVDRQLVVLIDGEPLFEPLAFEDARPWRRTSDSPVALGISGTGEATIDRFRLYRDVYYTDALAASPRRPFGVGEAYALGAGEYFVLGDNSPVSNDSRFWELSPVVHEEALIGKPFLVHLPSEAVPLEVFGHEIYWIPDPREIRYIR